MSGIGFDEIPEDVECPFPEPGENTIIYHPTARQVDQYSAVRAKTCGQCKYFDHREGQRRLFEKKRLLEIVYDQHWRADHLGDDPRRLGACGAGDGSTLTGPNHFGCDQFRVRR